VATEAGLEILRRGGNAFDAAVAVAATLNVVEPYNSGAGGYGLILVWDAEQARARVLNASGRIPVGVDVEVFRDSTPGYLDNRRGPKAISTPSNLRAWEELSVGYGALPWKELFEPAIAAARDGFVLLRGVDPRAFASFPEYARSFYGRDGEPLAAGERLVQRDLAASLTSIASGGAEVLHGGELGRRIAEGLSQLGSFVTLEDLKQSRAEWWEPISIDYRGHRVVTASPPANSFSSLLRLGLMSRFDVAALGHNSESYLHHFAEVTKNAFWHRLRYAGDPDHGAPPLDRLLDEGYWDEQAAALDLERARPFEAPGPSAPAGHQTTHFVVADAQGNVVSATQTLGRGFGSRVMVEGTGIWLNNSLYYCSFEPAGNPMDAHPGRRKLISNHPSFVLRDGRPWIAIGTPGGHTIGQTVPQMLMNMLDFDMHVQAAIAAPRVAFVEPQTLEVESGVAPEVRTALEARGHQLRVVEAIGNGHGLTIEYDEAGVPSRFTGGSDPRGLGVARGF
jgi:gamma-glutamyltranspeptidase/glutathione hydrolase